MVADEVGAEVGDVQPEGSRIGVSREGELLVKEGPLWADWVSEQLDVSAWALDGELTGVLIEGELLIKDDGVWTPKGTNVSRFELSDKPLENIFLSVDLDGMPRFGYTNIDKVCIEGLPGTGEIVRFQLRDSRVAVLLDDALYVKRRTNQNDGLSCEPEGEGAGEVGGSKRTGRPVRRSVFEGSRRSK